MAEDKFVLARGVLLGAVRPALTILGHSGLAAEQLVLGTGVQESRLVAREQRGGGPALGLFQMEPATHDDCWTNYLNFSPQKPLADRVRQTLEAGQKPVAATLRANDRSTRAIWRAPYLRGRNSLPNANAVAAMANYWKHHYNTPAGAGKPQEFLGK